MEEVIGCICMCLPWCACVHVCVCMYLKCIACTSFVNVATSNMGAYRCVGGESARAHVCLL